MSSIRTRTKKKHLAKANRQTRWAPFWTIPKVYGQNKKIHPGRHTTVKRTWRRGRIDA